MARLRGGINRYLKTPAFQMKINIMKDRGLIKSSQNPIKS